MTVTAAHAPPCRPIGTQATAHLFDQAVAGRIALQVRAAIGGRPGPEAVRGRFISGCESAATIGLDEVPRFGTEHDTTLHLTMVVEGLEYQAVATCLATNFDERRGAIRIQRPDRAVIVDRRRSPRRWLASSSEITLSGVSNGRHWRCPGALLNLSTDGIAFRVRDPGEHRIEVGDNLNISFAIGSHDEHFDLGGVVVSQTPGGTKGHLVIGMCFTADDRQTGARSRLGQLLKHER